MVYRFCHYVLISLVIGLPAVLSSEAGVSATHSSKVTSNLDPVAAQVYLYSSQNSPPNPGSLRKPKPKVSRAVRLSLAALGAGAAIGPADLLLRALASSLKAKAVSAEERQGPKRQRETRRLGESHGGLWAGPIAFSTFAWLAACVASRRQRQAKRAEAPTLKLKVLSLLSTASAATVAEAAAFPECSSHTLQFHVAKSEDASDSCSSARDGHGLESLDRDGHGFESGDTMSSPRSAEGRERFLKAVALKIRRQVEYYEGVGTADKVLTKVADSYQGPKQDEEEEECPATFDLLMPHYSISSVPATPADARNPSRKSSAKLGWSDTADLQVPHYNISVVPATPTDSRNPSKKSSAKLGRSDTADLQVPHYNISSELATPADSRNPSRKSSSKLGWSDTADLQVPHYTISSELATPTDSRNPTRKSSSKLGWSDTADLQVPHYNISSELATPADSRNPSRKNSPKLGW
ncbi:unnamed protein product [Polarella glacialis]|uniref:Uncharacterized protein n=1 Tax=Polarella glacialis TaxID=89957 RepID=A0A813HZF1_POLGL|nr:unnamed protein product [Polarella glacialis]